jgi:hypothetical protein
MNEFKDQLRTSLRRIIALEKERDQICENLLGLIDNSEFDFDFIKCDGIIIELPDLNVVPIFDLDKTEE